jgi:gamma-glutamyltranspeptidase/glutathione hydrolase
MVYHRAALAIFTLFVVNSSWADDRDFRGVVSSATPEATAAGVTILEAGGNAIDAAVAVSLTLGVTEPAGSGIAGQTVMLVKKPGEPAFVIQGTTWSPRRMPKNATDERLSSGHTAASVPSTLRVLDLAHRKFGSGNLGWGALVQPAIDQAEHGFVVGPFRERAFRFYGDRLRPNAAAANIFFKADGSGYRAGDRLAQPLLAGTLRRIALAGAMDFYRGEIAEEIAADVVANDGWITLRDLEKFPEPDVVPALRSSYRGFDVETLPPPFGGWVVLQILNILEQSDPELLGNDDSDRRLALLDAMRIAHGQRRSDPVTNYKRYARDIETRTSKAEAQRLLTKYRSETGGETTHFSVVDGNGMAVAVTQSIDSYFGAKVAHPTLGFLYNNYMQGFQVDDADAPYYLEEKQMPLSSMSATIVSKGGEPRLVLGSPGSARIISAVAQVTSHWVDVDKGVKEAVAAYRVHSVPEDSAYVEGVTMPPELLGGMAERGLTVVRPTYGVSDSQLDPYFGGVHALALENGVWTGSADPRRDGQVTIAGVAGESSYEFSGWAGPPINVRLFVPANVAPDTPVVVVMHGWSREAQRYYDDWRAPGEEKGFIVVVPHFPQEEFPTANDYNQGHVFDADTGEIRQKQDWTFSAIEALFDDVVARIGGSQAHYTLYGHSAGSQFVHRFLYYMPEARVKRFIAANAGWYTMPDFDTEYPYGLEGAAISEEQLVAALEKDVILMLGREDLDSTDPNLRNTPEAKQQGTNRFARGLKMFAAAQKAADGLGIELQWQLRIVDDAGHDNSQIAPAAATLISTE